MGVMQPLGRGCHLTAKSNYVFMRFAGTAGFCLFLMGSVAVGQTPSADGLEAKAEVYLNSLARYERFSGVALIAQGDAVLYEGAHGWADYDGKVKMRPDHVLGVGSLSKQYTAAGILKLASEGKLGLTDTLSQWLPNWSPAGDSLQLQHLLSHTSGLSRDIGRAERFEDIIFPSEEVISLRELLDQFADATLLTEPGDSYEYNNINYMLLAAVIEEASGMDYTEYLMEVLGKDKGTVLYGDIRTVPAEVRTEQYMGMPTAWTQQPRWDLGWLIGAGNVATTAKGMNAWISQLQDPSFLPAEYLEKMITGHASISGGRKYGYGWEVSKKDDVRRVEHDGAVNGYVAQVVWLPDTDVRVVVMTNHTHELEEIGSTTRLVKEIAETLLGLVKGGNAETLPLAQSTVTGFVPGMYRLDDGREVMLSVNEGTVMIESQGDSAWSALDLPYLDNHTVSGRMGKRLHRVADGFGLEDYGKVLKECNLMIRALLNPEKIGGFWGGVVEEAGTYQYYRIYAAETDGKPVIYKIALHYAEDVVGLSLYMKGGKIQGMFIDQGFTHDGPSDVKGLPIGDGQAFVDGFRLGYGDGYLRQQDEDTLVLTIQGVEYRMSK